MFYAVFLAHCNDWPKLYAYVILYIIILQITRQPTIDKIILHNSPAAKNWCAEEKDNEDEVIGGNK
jgi:hypothetical protein